MANLAASHRRGEEFCRVKAAIRIKIPTNARHGFQISFVEQKTDVGLFLETDAVLARDAAAKLDAGAQSGFSSFDNAIQFSWSTHIKKNVWMKIAVAGMKNISDAQVKLLADLGYSPHHLWQLAAWHNTVLNVIIRR